MVGLALDRLAAHDAEVPGPPQVEVAANSRAPFALPAWLRWFFKDPKALVGLLAVLVYAVVRVTVEAFYQEFEVSPEDAGVTQARIIARASIYLILFLAVLVAAVALVTAIGLYIVDLLSGRASASSTRHLEHDPTRAQVASALWGAAVLIVALLVALSILAPELTAFLIGYQRQDYIEPASLRMSSAAWSASLAVVAFFAFQNSCPIWNRVEVGRRWRAGAAAVFVPLAVLVVFALVSHPPRRGGQHAAEVLLLVIALAWPFAVAAAAVVSWFRHKRQWNPKQRFGASIIASSVVFYLLVLPASLAVVSDQLIRHRFASSAKLFDLSDAHLSERLALVEHLWPLAIWAGAVTIAVVCVLLLGGCRGHNTSTLRQSRAEPAFIVALVALTACSVLFLADQRGRTMALRVRHGDRLRPPGALVLATAEPVCVAGTSTTLSPGPWMLIGKTSDSLILGDPRDGPTEVLPPSGISLEYVHHDVFPGPERDDAIKMCASFAQQVG